MRRASLSLPVKRAGVAMTYTHLTLEERYQIWAERKTGRNRPETGEMLRQSEARISREWRRNQRQRDYRPAHARHRARHRTRGRARRSRAPVRIGTTGLDQGPFFRDKPLQRMPRSTRLLVYLPRAAEPLYAVSRSPCASHFRETPTGISPRGPTFPVHAPESTGAAYGPPMPPFPLGGGAHPRKRATQPKITSTGRNVSRNGNPPAGCIIQAPNDSKTMATQARSTTQQTTADEPRAG